MRVAVTLSLVGALLLLAPAPAQAQGTHFFAEGGVGVTTGLSDSETTDPGAMVTGMFGVGGRPASSWLRYYLILELMHGQYDRLHEQNLRAITLERSLFEAGLGLRVVAPLIPTLRFFADIEGVLISSSTDFVGVHLVETESDDFHGGLRLGAGLQFRPIELISVNGRLSMTTAFTDLDAEAGEGWLVGFDAEEGHYEGILSVAIYF